MSNNLKAMQPNHSKVSNCAYDCEALNVNTIVFRVLAQSYLGAVHAKGQG